MKRLQMSIAATILVVVACAMALTALRTASDFWLSALYTVTTVLLLLAVVAARFGRGSGKAFWFGFAVFGWGFFLLGYGPWRTPRADPTEQFNVPLNRNLITSRVILYLVPYLITESDDLEDIDKITANTISIAHVLVTLALAVGGGFIAVVMRRRRGRVGSVKSLAILATVALLTARRSRRLLSSDDRRRSSPIWVFGKDKGDSPDFVAKWYSEHLAAIGEPSLWMLSRRDSEATAYRLLWLPTFHHPVCVRIDRTRDGAKLRARVLNGMGGYAPGQIAIDRSVTLGADQFIALNRRLEQAAFWEMPTELGDLGLDGDQLIVEGVTTGKYHVVDRWEPDPAYAKLCLNMLDLTGLKVQKTWRKYHANNELPEM